MSTYHYHHLYFKGLTKSDTHALRARLNQIAAALGYTTERGTTAGQGNLAKLLQAIDAGEIALVLLDDLQRSYVTDYLHKTAASRVDHTFQNTAITKALQVIADSLERATQKGEPDQ